jgi:hypothetical protein
MCDAADLPELAPPDYHDPVIEVFKKNVDRTLLRDNLKLTVEERIRKAQSFHESMARWQGVAWRTPSAAPVKDPS